MRNWAAAAVLLGAGTLASAQEAPNTNNAASAKSGNWFTQMFSWGAKPEAKKDDDKKKSEPPSALESASAVRVSEGKVLDRRNAAILKLREIAVRTGDESLLRKADELDERAVELYMQRTGGAPSTTAAAAREEKR